MHLTQKIKIKPTPEQIAVLWHLSELCRLIYNFALAERKETWERINLYSYLQVFQWGKPEFHEAMNKRIRKRSNQIKDTLHKQTRKLVNNTKANTIIIGDLDLKEMPKSKKAPKSLNRSTQNNGYISRFVGFPAYKVKLAGKKVIEIDARNTSRRCYVCGKQHNMPLWKRTMECDCGNVIDRDRNSAINNSLIICEKQVFRCQYWKHTRRKHLP